MAQPPLSLVPNKARRTARLNLNAAGRARPRSLKNRQALKLVQAWMNAPDDKGADWWHDFERELAKRRPSFRTT